MQRASPGYLAEEIRQRVARGPLNFQMQIQLAGEGDKLQDPSIEWPETRETVDVGRIEITSVAADSPKE